MPNKKGEKKNPKKMKEQKPSSDKKNPVPESQVKGVFDFAIERMREISKKYEVK
jgi:hypothetical protein